MIGEGGMATVYLATYKDTAVAVKQLKNGFAVDEQNTEFIHELDILLGLDSPFIVKCLGGNVKLNYIVMEFVIANNSLLILFLDTLNEDVCAICWTTRTLRRHLTDEA